MFQLLVLYHNLRKCYILNIKMSVLCPAKKFDLTLDELIEITDYEDRCKYETDKNYCTKFHLCGIPSDDNYGLIERCDNKITLFHWELFNKNGKQYLSGYLPNGNRWYTSSIYKINMCYDEYNFTHLRVKTKNTTYKLPVREAAFQNSWLDLDSRYSNRKNFYNQDLSNVIDIEDWKLTDRNWRGGSYHTYYLEGDSPNGYSIISSKITNIVFYRDYDEQYIIFITNTGFQYRANYNRSRYLNERIYV